jgi:uncharacterized RDD family membrane protein YckC
LLKGVRAALRMTEGMLGAYPREAYDVPVATADASISDAEQPAGLPYAPGERLAPSGARYAPWWRRVSAFVIDASAVITAISAFAAPILVLAGFRHTDVSHREATWLFVSLLVATIVGGLAYAIVLEGRSGQTFGKRAVGVRVVAEDGSRCGYGRAANRELLGRLLIGGFSWLLVLPGMLSYLAALWDPQRQTWHDKIGETIVVRVERELVQPPASLTALERAPTLLV